MKPHRKEKIHSKEWKKMKEIGFNYHKYLWKKFKKRIKTKRFR